jgi:hypothetical protein
LKLYILLPSIPEGVAEPEKLIACPKHDGSGDAVAVVFIVYDTNGAKRGSKLKFPISVKAGIEIQFPLDET